MPTAKTVEEASGLSRELSYTCEALHLPIANSTGDSDFAKLPQANDVAHRAFEY